MTPEDLVLIENSITQLRAQNDELRATVEKRFTMLEERDELLERQLASLTMGYAEMAAMIQAVLSSIMNESDEAKRKEFFQHVKESRETMMDNMSHAARHAEQSIDKFIPYSTGDAQGPASAEGSEQ